MQVFGYYDLTTKNLSNALDQESGVTLPTIIAGETLRFNIRFRETRDGVPREVNPNVRAMKAVLGVVDQRPSTGGFKIDVDGEETAAPITYTPDETTGIDENFADKIKTAIESLASFSSGDVVVEERNNSFVVTFPNDSPSIERTFTIVENRLHPRCFVRVRSYERGETWEHELRLVKAPAAYTNTFERENGPIPEVEELRAGGSVDDTEWTEIQKLYVPPGFPGTYRLVKDSYRSEPLSTKSTVEDILAAITPLADPGGIFNVTNPADYTAYIEFDGDMRGQDFANLGIEIFDGPEADYVVALDTNTREMADAMQSVDSQQMVLEIHAEMEDVDDPGVYYWHSLYRKDISIHESVDWEELATAPNIDWLNPPTFTSYNVFSPSQVSNGQIHYSTTLGDGAATTFAINHGLNADNINVIVTENSSPGAHKIPGTDYTWVRDNANQVTITWLDGTPTSAEFAVTVLGLVQTSFFDPHTHEISDITGLQEWMDDMENRVSNLESTTGGGIGTSAGSEEEETARWKLPTVFELYPSKTQPTRPESGAISDVDVNEVGESGRPVIGRARGLLGAIHDATAEALTIPVPNASDSLKGRVFQNQSGSRYLLPGGLGNRSRYLEPNEFAACDGRLWYPVSQYGQYEAHEVSIDTGTDDELWTFTDLTEGEFLAEGTTIQLETTGTLPAGFATGTDYTVQVADHEAGTYKLYDSDGDVVVATDDGTGTHSIVRAAEISYYPSHFERTLFTLHVNDKQLRPRKQFDLAFMFESVVLNANTEAQWSLMLEIGEARGVNTAGTEGVNLEEIVWRKIPALEQRIILTPSSTTHRFGCRINRRIKDTVDTITLQKLIYGALESGAVPPTTGNFSIRARLGRFDTVDSQTDPRGFVMLSGLNIEPLDDGESGFKPGDFEYGFAVIK